MDEDEKCKLVTELRGRMSDVEPLPHENFTTTDTCVHAYTHTYTHTDIHACTVAHMQRVLFI